MSACGSCGRQLRRYEETSGLCDPCELYEGQPPLHCHDCGEETVFRPEHRARCPLCGSLDTGMVGEPVA